MSEEAATTQQSETEEQPKSMSLLAKEMFGDNFHGEVQEPEAPEEPESEEPEQPEGEEPEGEEPEQPEEPEGEEPESEETEGEPESVEYEISHLAELFGTDESQLHVNDDGKIVFRGKVDGEYIETPAKDLIDNFQMYQAADKRLEEAKATRDALTKEISQKGEELQSQFATAAKLIQNAEKLIDQDSNSIDWKALREDDPAEYSAKKAEIAERREQIEKMKREAHDEYQQSVESYKKQAQEQQQQMLAKEQEALLSKLPEWKDENKAQAEKKQLVTYLQNNGFSESEVGAAADHRLILMARKAMLYDQGQGKVSAAKKKVAKVPKVIKPGAPKPQEQAKQEKLGKARQRLQKEGSLEAALEYRKLKSRSN